LREAAQLAKVSQLSQTQPLQGEAAFPLVGWDERGNQVPKRAEHRQFVDALCAIEPEIAEASSLACEFLRAFPLKTSPIRPFNVVYPWRT